MSKHKNKIFIGFTFPDATFFGLPFLVLGLYLLFKFFIMFFAGEAKFDDIFAVFIQCSLCLLASIPFTTIRVIHIDRNRLYYYDLYMFLFKNVDTYYLDDYDCAVTGSQNKSTRVSQGYRTGKTWYRIIESEILIYKNGTKVELRIKGTRSEKTARKILNMIGELSDIKVLN